MGLQPTARMPRYIVQPKAILLNHVGTTKVTKLGIYVHYFLLFSNSASEPANNKWCFLSASSPLCWFNNK